MVSKPKSGNIPLEFPGADGRMHAFALEFVPSLDNPRAGYLVFDGQRVAELDIDPATDKFVWVPLVDWFEIKAVPGLDQPVVLFDDDRLH